ncbi:hypothetical protein [Streptantibioticus silvisoli]|uniref:Uncharacterized protein n=1 Tax=Streptantibioticus silvisoli TaxID=2705255 RepID=A0ABT6W589_9ACTN|nr:hypothetical protein [Streptantibioticus silvisoli]MDI5964833.1 hypothetical protein [Streptantibioticus silvisoli]
MPVYALVPIIISTLLLAWGDWNLIKAVIRLADRVNALESATKQSTDA